jgi:hypothetical protein
MPNNPLNLLLMCFLISISFFYFQEFKLIERGLKTRKYITHFLRKSSLINIQINIKMEDPYHNNQQVLPYLVKPVPF